MKVSPLAGKPAEPGMLLVWTAIPASSMMRHKQSSATPLPRFPQDRRPAFPRRAIPDLKTQLQSSVRI